MSEIKRHIYLCMTGNSWKSKRDFASVFYSTFVLTTKHIPVGESGKKKKKKVHSISKNISSQNKLVQYKC